MIRGVGTDIVEIDRVRAAVTKKSFREKVYTEKERSYCESRGRNSAASYAARFAAKEAFFKALGTGITGRLTEVEIENDEQGRPRINLRGEWEFRGEIHLSMSHSREYATAICILEARG